MTKNKFKDTGHYWYSVVVKAQSSHSVYLNISINKKPVKI